MFTPLPPATPIPEGSFLRVYSDRGAFTDCYATDVKGKFHLPALIESVYTSPLFKMERWILARLLNLPSTDQQARQVAFGESTTFAAWKVENRSENEILLNAGQTRTWLCVRTATQDPASTTLYFGSAVVPQRAGGELGLIFKALLGFHRLYSKLLLAAAAKRIATVERAQRSG